MAVGGAVGAARHLGWDESECPPLPATGADGTPAQLARAHLRLGALQQTNFTRGTRGRGYSGYSRGGGTRGYSLPPGWWGYSKYSFSVSLQMASTDCLSDANWKDMAYGGKSKTMHPPIYEQQRYTDPNSTPSPGGKTQITVKLWSHLSDILLSRVLERGRKLSSGKSNPNCHCDWNVAYQTQIGLQRRLNTTNFYVIYAFAV